MLLLHQVGPIVIFVAGVIALIMVGRLRRKPAQTLSLSGRRTPANDTTSNVVIVMQVIVSMVLLAAGLFVVLSTTYTPQAQHWGYGTIGSVLGFWLRH